MNLKVEASKKSAPKIASQKAGFLMLWASETGPKMPRARARAVADGALGNGWSAPDLPPGEAPAMPA
jgi:hypothetical protein